jgi:hypothetical protein
MTISHKPENTSKTNEANPSLGKLTDTERHNNINYPWVIVEGAGCDDEQIASEHRSFSDAVKKMHRAYDDDEIEGMPVCIMKRDENGTLTTEF